MVIAATVERLRTLVTGLRLVEEAAGLEAAMSGNLSAPAAYVIPLSEHAADASNLGRHQHWETHLFGVILVVETRRVASGASVVDLNALRSQIKAALIGWVPDTTSGEPLNFVGGELIEFAGGGRLWWSDEFTHKTLYVSTNT